MNESTRVARPPPKPLMIFDGECGFCRFWIERWRRITGDLVDYLPFQDPRIALEFPEIPRDRLEQAVHLVEVGGVVTSGAEAAFRTLAVTRRWPLWLFRNVPGAAPVGEAAYRAVARHRAIFSFLTQLFWGRHPEPPGHILVRSLFLRLLGMTYLLAFLSFGSQILGLIGSRGILPASQTMEFLEQQMPEAGLARFVAAPTLCWWGTDDAFLRGQCIAGAAIAALLVAGVAPLPCLVALWVLYLSLVTVGNVFLGYQWDNLLLEAGLLAIFFAPLRPWMSLRADREPSHVALWLLRWLTFRLMFASGCVKLLSGDPTWRNLTALNFHYETQPLPTALAWFAHQLPGWIQKLSVLGMFGVELVVPFLIFLPRRARLLAFWLFVPLQIVIVATGNYTFFNLLSIVLCLPLLDDSALRQAVPTRWRERLATALAAPRAPLRAEWRHTGLALVSIFGLVVLTITTLQLVGMFRGRMKGWWWAGTLYHYAAPFRSINSYGLFAVMTTSRPEIIVEGSNDGRTWLPYEFPHKPGDSKRRPRFVAPHQPRLDWQMWFAALNPGFREPWFMNFAVRLLQGSPEVLALVEKNPFPQAPPKFVRAAVYDYHFTDRVTRRADGSWWRREFKGYYCPPISLRAAEASKPGDLP